MPHSSEAYNGLYNPKPIPKQNFNHVPHPSVNVNVNELNEIPSTSGGASNTKKIWIIGCLATLALLAVGAGLAGYFVFSRQQTSATNTTTSSTISSANITSSTTAGSSNLNSTTLSTSSGASTTVSSSSTASTSVSTSSVSTATTVAAGFSASGAVVSGTTAWFGYEQVTVTCTANLNNITIKIFVQKTVNATYWSNTYNTFWGGTMNQAYLDNGTQIIYTWTIVSGQTIQSSGSPYTAQAQFQLYGVNQPTSTDIYQVTATTVGGVTSTFSGYF